MLKWNFIQKIGIVFKINWHYLPKKKARKENNVLLNRKLFVPQQAPFYAAQIFFK
jgi:hypothetical protein